MSKYVEGFNKGFEYARDNFILATSSNKTASERSSLEELYNNIIQSKIASAQPENVLEKLLENLEGGNE